MKCNWCGSSNECIEGCECQKCIDPKGYDNWKFKPDGTFSEGYKTWLKKERKKYNNITQVVKYQRSDDYFYDCISEPKLQKCLWCKDEALCVGLVWYVDGEIILDYRKNFKNPPIINHWYCCFCIENRFTIEKDFIHSNCDYCKREGATKRFALNPEKGDQVCFGVCEECHERLQRRINVVVKNYNNGNSLTRIPSDRNAGQFFWD